MMRFKQLLAITLGVCFVVLAALQYSRPLAVLWVSAYLAAAMFSFMAGLEKISRALLLAAFVAYGAGAIYFWPGHWPGAKLLADGQALQLTNGTIFLTLSIASLSMLLFAVLSRRKTDLHPPHIPGHVKRWAN